MRDKCNSWWKMSFFCHKSCVARDQYSILQTVQFLPEKNDGSPFESGPRRKVVIQNRLVLRTVHFLRYLMAFTLSRYHFPVQWDSYDRI